MHGAGASGASLITTISVVTDATHIVLADNASTAKSSAATEIYYGTDDLTAINAAKTEAENTQRILAFPEGGYIFSTTIEFAYADARVLALSPLVRLVFTGTGVAVSWNGPTYNPTGGVYRCDFGGAFQFEILGTSECTHLVYVNNVHHSRIRYRGRNCTGSILKGDSLLAGTPTGPGCAVLTKFWVEVSYLADQIAFSVQPGLGIDLDSIFVCAFYDLNVEGCGAGNKFSANKLTGTISDSGTGTVFERCDGQTDSAVAIANTTASSSKTIGALTVAGGAGISGTLNVGGEISIPQGQVLRLGGPDSLTWFEYDGTNVTLVKAGVTMGTW